jgi:hypothetical protein
MRSRATQPRKPLRREIGKHSADCVANWGRRKETEHKKGNGLRRSGHSEKKDKRRGRQMAALGR